MPGGSQESGKQQLIFFKIHPDQKACRRGVMHLYLAYIAPVPCIYCICTLYLLHLFLVSVII